MLLALVYIMPNFSKNTSTFSDGTEQTSQENFASDVEEKEFIDTEINLTPNCSDNNMWRNYVISNYIGNQVPIEPVIKRPTPPPQA